MAVLDGPEHGQHLVVSVVESINPALDDDGATPGLASCSPGLLVNIHEGFAGDGVDEASRFERVWT
jgi:hypothetical protein